MTRAETCPQLNVQPKAQSGRERVSARGDDSSIFSPEAWARIARSLDLSGRELQIVRGTFDGQTEFAMAVALYISPSTVHTHIERLHHKLFVTDRVGLLLRVMREFIALTTTPGNDLPPICPTRATLGCHLYR